MVVTKVKFICGHGPTTLHYCRLCGEPYLNPVDAEECERGHGSLRRKRGKEILRLMA